MSDFWSWLRYPSFQIQGLWSRFFPVYHKLREQLKENTVGKVNYVTANFGANIQRFARLKEKSLGGGCVLDLGIYAIQMALLVYDHAEPEKIIASGILNDQGNKNIKDNEKMTISNKIKSLKVLSDRY